jgi:hypothetical protein
MLEGKIKIRENTRILLAQFKEFPGEVIRMNVQQSNPEVP